MRKLGLFLIWFCLVPAALAQELSGLLADLPKPHDYVLKRVSSWDRTGANDDMRKIAAGETFTVFEESGPGVITHIWFTIASAEAAHLKKLVLRMYWDNEPTPIGDFFGLGLGEYFTYQSLPLAVGSTKALNSFFPMPFQKMAKITVTNEGKLPVNSFYFNIDYRKYAGPLAADTLYFHAQYRQATPNHGWTNQWQSNGDPFVNGRPDLTGEDNYV